MNWPRLLCKPSGMGVRRVKGMVAFTLVLYTCIPIEIQPFWEQTILGGTKLPPKQEFLNHVLWNRGVKKKKKKKNDTYIPPYRISKRAPFLENMHILILTNRVQFHKTTPPPFFFLFLCMVTHMYNLVFEWLPRSSTVRNFTLGSVHKYLGGGGWAKWRGPKKFWVAEKGGPKSFQ